jgi:hypothetical protein
MAAEKPTEEVIARMHRYFAIQCNNAAWDLADQVELDGDGQRELLRRAYASAYHWSHAGTALNAARAELLLAHVHTLLGHGALAKANAERAQACFESGQGEDWDLAFAFAIHARAAALNGDSRAHEELRARAVRQRLTVQDPGNRKVLDAFFAKLGFGAE